MAGGLSEQRGQWAHRGTPELKNLRGACRGEVLAGAVPFVQAGTLGTHPVVCGWSSGRSGSGYGPAGVPRSGTALLQACRGVHLSLPLGCDSQVAKQWPSGHLLQA